VIGSIPEMLDQAPPRSSGSSSSIYAYLGGSLLAAGGTAALELTHHRRYSGLTALIGALLLITAAVAGQERDGRRGTFASRVADWVFEACVLAPLAWVSRSGSNADAILAMVALGASFVASYERAKGQALGYRGSETPVYRAIRALLLALALLTGLVKTFLSLFLALTLTAAVVRAWNVALQERRPRAVR